MKMRFSLRGLLIFTGCLSVYFYGRTRSERIACEIVAAIEQNDFKKADSFFGEDKTFERWAQWNDINEFPAECQILVNEGEQSWLDLWLGTTRLNVKASFRGGGLSAGIDGVVTATPFTASISARDSTILVSGPKIGYQLFRSRISKGSVVSSPGVPLELTPAQIVALIPSQTSPASLQNANQ